MIQNLRKFLKDIADAIREKEGSTEAINPQDFVARIKDLGGVSEVPTLECWKIVVTEDNRDSTLDFINGYLGWEIQGKMMCTTHLLSSEYDMDIILPGPLIFGGSGPWPECLHELYILIYKKCFDADGQYDGLLEQINAVQGEKITLNEWLEITALAKNWSE